MASGVLATLGDLPALPTLAAFKAMEYRPSAVDVAGRTGPGDGFGGTFDWYKDDATPADDVLTVECTGGAEAGRYKRRIVDGIANPLWWNELLSPSDTTAAFRAAAATGLHVRIPERLNELDGGFRFVTNGQYLLGLGIKSVLRPIGSFDLFEVTDGVTGCFADNFLVEGWLQTGGYIAAVRNGARLKFDHIIAVSPFNGFYAEMVNQLTFGSIWMGGVRGEFMFHLYGSRTKRSDVVAFENVTVSADDNVPEDDRATALMWDGNVHTVDLSGLRVINPRRGIVTANTAGGSWPNETPAFLSGGNFQCDYPTFEALKLDIGFDMKLATPYLANSRKSAGVVIGQQCALVSVNGGICSGHAKEGVVSGGKDVTISGLNVVGNSWGDVGKYPGVRVTATGRGNAFSGCRSGNREGIGATHSYGLLLEAGAIDTTWEGGSLAGNMIEPWRNDSAMGDNNFRVSAAGARLSVMNDQVFGSASGFGASFAPNIVGGAIPTVTVLTGGLHFAFPPTLYAFDPDNTGTGWTGNAVVANGAVTEVVTDTPGTGYGPRTIVFGQSQSVYPMIRPYSAVASVPMQFGGKGGGGVQLFNDQGMVADFFNAANAVNFPQFFANASGGPVIMRAQGTDPHIVLQLGAKGGERVQLFNEQGVLAEFANAAAAVNFVQFFANAAGQSVLLKAVGVDTDINLIVFAKGGEGVTLRNDVGVMADFRALPGAVNFLQFFANATGGPVFIQPEGADPNIDVVLRGKGTGVPDFHIPQAVTAGAALGFIHFKVNDVLVAVEIKALA